MWRKSKWNLYKRYIWIFFHFKIVEELLGHLNNIVRNEMSKHDEKNSNNKTDTDIFLVCGLFDDNYPELWETNAYKDEWMDCRSKPLIK